MQPQLLNLSINNNDLDFGSVELTLSPFDLNDITEGLNQTTIVTKLTQIIATVGVFICFFGILSNVLSIIVLNRKAMKKLSTYAYLLGLSISDVISLIFTVIIWLQYALPVFGFKPSVHFINYHKILLVYVYPVVSSTQALSVWLTLAFTVDRYLYVCHPYFGRIYCTRKRAFCVIAALFLIAAIYSIPQFLERTFVHMNVLGEMHVFMTMTSLGSNNYFVYVYHLFIYIMFVCLLPMLTIVILNAFLINDIVESNRRHRTMSFAPRSQSINHHLAEKKSKCSEWLKSPRTLFKKCCATKEAAARTPTPLSSSVTEPTLVQQPLTSIAEQSCLLTPVPQLSVSASHSTSAINGSSSFVAGAGGSSRMIKSKSDTMMTTQHTSNNNSMDKTLRNDVTVMIVGLIVVFLICQLPSSILRLLMFQNIRIQFEPAYVYSLDVSNFLIVVNSTLNCVLCVMLGRKFRREFFQCFFGRFVKTRASETSTYYLNTMHTAY